MNKKNIRLSLFIVLILTIILVPICKTFSSTETQEEYSLTAKICNTNEYTSGIELTEDGIELTNWEYKTSKYLEINPIVPDDENLYIVTIELPKEIYVVGDSISLPSGYSNTEFTKNENITVNNSEIYEANKLSGKIEYIMNDTATSGTIQLELRYDETLWDKQSNSILTAEGINPVNVKLSKKDANENITILKEKSIKKAYSSLGQEIVENLYYQAGSNSEVLNSAITLSTDQTVKIRSLFSQTSDNISWYYDKLLVNITLPYYEDSNGKKYYLELDTENLALTAISNPDYQIDTSSEGKVTITLNKPYFKSGEFMSMNFKTLNQELLDLEKTSYVFQGGKIEAIADSNTQIKNINIYSIGIENITYKTSSYENIAFITTNNDGHISILNKPSEAVARLGGFYITNSGTGDSVSKEIYQEFDIENSNYINVTTINLLTDRINENVTIEYSLVDENGNQIYFDENGNIVDSLVEGTKNTWTTTIKNENYNNTGIHKQVMLSRKNLISAHQNYFFKTIKYEVEKITAGDNLYNTSNNKTGSGNFYGYTSDNVTVSNIAKNKITITTPENSDITEISSTNTTNFEESSNNSAYFTNIAMSKNSIQAGNSFNLTGTLQHTSYQYGNATWLNNIIIGLVLPTGISVNEQGVTANISNKTDITGFDISMKDLGNGTNLWTIKYPQNTYIGYYNENLEVIDNKENTNFSIQLDTDSTLNATTVLANSCLFATGNNQINVADGEYSYTKVQDAYDLNENTRTDDTIIKVNSSDTTSCQIISKSDTLEVKSSVILNSLGNIGQESQDIIMQTKDDIVIYNVDIKCANGGYAEDFCGFIPIPKSVSGRDNYLVESTVENSFDFDLQSSATITGNDIFTIQYSFVENLTYETAKTATTWYSADDISNNQNLLWENVTMIKISANTQVENENNTRITINLKYGGENYIKEVGAKNKWYSTFGYNFTNSERVTSGNYSTNSVTTTLNSTETLADTTLTAAKDMQPVIDGNKNEQIITFNEFKKAQKFSIVNVETYNVALKTKDYMLANTKMTGIEANETFAITAQIPGQEEQNILNTASTNPILLGTVEANNILEYKLKIYNANALSDNSQTRYIIITLKSDNGLTLKQKININRELTEASDPKSAIVTGKRYITFDDKTTSVNTAQDSSITAQFVLTYIPDLYSVPKLTFSNSLPINTKIIFMNLTNSETPSYWYKKIDTSTTEISLSEFTKMGTITENFVSTSGKDIITEKFLAIIDFSECIEYLEQATTVQMIFEGNNVSDFYLENLKFVPTAKRTFEISTSNSEIEVGTELKVNYNMVATASDESKYTGRKLALVITAPENLPIDSYMFANDTNYYLNSNKQFIIPLDDVQNGDGELTIKLNSNSLPISAENYECVLQLWVSATANAEAPLLGEKVAEQNIQFTKKADLNPALKVINMNKRALKQEDIAQTNTLAFDYKPASNCIVQIELQQKDGNTYQKITDKLNKINETTEHTQGVFEIPAVSGENTISYNLSSTIESGTYRFVIRVKDENNKELLVLPYNFVVLEE